MPLGLMSATAEQYRSVRQWSRGSPFDDPLLPDQNPVADPEQQSHDRREVHRHDDQRRIDLAVIGVRSRPVDIPTESGLNADSLGNDQREERRAEPHE